MTKLILAAAAIVGGMIISEMDLSGVAECTFNNREQTTLVNLAQKRGESAFWQCETDAFGNVISRQLIIK